MSCGAHRRLKRRAVALVNERRIAADLPTTDMYLGLHVGEVFYGNIGSEERLDFTVVGPAVNEVSRIASMCRPRPAGASSLPPSRRQSANPKDSWSR